MNLLPSTKDELRTNKLSKQDFFNLPRNPIYIVLDSLKCAHNIGTILRLADAVLASKVYICGNTLVPPSRKIKNGSQGAERWVPWEYIERADQVVQLLKSQGVQIVSLEITPTSIPYSEAQYASPTCLVLGREYDGVSPEVLALSDLTVHLPMQGMSNSINVACAGSVLLYKMLKNAPKSLG
jgi:tRNA G18 (ribose-2'-O)-methylase SpoU